MALGAPFRNPPSLNLGGGPRAPLPPKVESSPAPHHRNAPFTGPCPSRKGHKRRRWGIARGCSPHTLCPTPQGPCRRAPPPPPHSDPCPRSRSASAAAGDGLMTATWEGG